MPTVGQLMIDEVLPPALRGRYKALNKKGISEIAEYVARNHPDQYREIFKKLSDLSAEAGFMSGGYSFGPEHMDPGPESTKLREELNQRVHAILSDTSLNAKMRDAKLIQTSLEYMDPLQKTILAEHQAAGNPLALQVVSGAKGKAENLRSLVAGDTLYADANYNPVPYPIQHSFAEGLRPHEYFAGSYGARQSLTLTKLGTADGGYLSKRLNNLSHRLVVSDDDGPDPHGGIRGLPVDTHDPANEGALLSAPIGGHQRNTILTREVLADLKRKGHDEILIRSPLVGGPADGGVYGKDVGIRERGVIAPKGDYVGLAAAQSLSEPMTQMIIGSKHGGGVAGATKGQQGFPVLDRMFSVPKEYTDGALHAQQEGSVDQIRPAPQGGHYVTINGHEHYARPDAKIKVAVGDKVEAGDMLTDGLPNPAEFVAHKGIGEGRRLFLKHFVETSHDVGFDPDRRNIELVARGLIDHVRVDRELGDHAPGDVVSYQNLESSYEPRPGTQVGRPNHAVGQYLERPALHYTIGTKVTRSVADTMGKYGVDQVHTHASPPDFTPVMIRSQDTLKYDSDWMTQMLGSGLEKNLLTAAARGAVADPKGTSYVTPLAEGLHFGEMGKTKGWDAQAAKKPIL